MKNIRLEEFDDLKEAERWMNDCSKEIDASKLKIIPYAIEPCVTRYLVVLTQWVDE